MKVRSLELSQGSLTFGCGHKSSTTTCSGSELRYPRFEPVEERPAHLIVLPKTQIRFPSERKPYELRGLKVRSPWELSAFGSLFAWILFLGANACPAVALDLGSWSVGEVKFVPGYLCTGVFWPYWLSNALMLLSPGLLWLDSGRKGSRGVRWAFAVICFISFVASFFLIPMFKAIHIGHWLWTASFLIGGFAAIPWRDDVSPASRQ